MKAEGLVLHRYRLFGLGLRSAIELPELEPCSRDDHVAVEISLGSIAPCPDAEPEELTATPEGAVLTIDKVARFRISDGEKIVVDPDPAASSRNVRLFLLGSAMGMLLHQRRILPLHANAIDIDGAAVAFMGHSGAGKSTLAAAFHDRGRSILSDDVCAVVPNGDQFVAQPGIPRLRLWRDAVERTGRQVDDYERAFEALDKYTVGIGRGAHAAAMPLKAIYLLVREESGETGIRRLSGIAAVEALIENTYRGRFIARFGDPKTHLTTCLAISRAVPIFVLSRPWDAAAIAGTMAQIEEHLDSLNAVAD